MVANTQHSRAAIQKMAEMVSVIGNVLRLRNLKV